MAAYWLGNARFVIEADRRESDISVLGLGNLSKPNYPNPGWMKFKFLVTWAHLSSWQSLISIAHEFTKKNEKLIEKKPGEFSWPCRWSRELGLLGWRHVYFDTLRRENTRDHMAWFTCWHVTQLLLCTQANLPASWGTRLKFTREETLMREKRKSWFRKRIE